MAAFALRMTPDETTGEAGKDAAHVDGRELAQCPIFVALADSALRLVPRPS